MSVWIVYPLAAIGALVVGSIAISALAEIVRSARQSVRVAAVAARAYDRRRRPTIKAVLFAFRGEFLSNYSSLRIGVFEVPRDPSKPIRSAW